MQGPQNTRWVAVSALAAAMFSIGFSITGVACSVRGTTAAEARQNDERIPTVPSAIAPAASAPAASVVQNAPAPSAASSATTGSLHVRRLVVTRKIENHEPVEDKEITLGGAPIYAFVELENEGPSARAVRILFENEHSQATVGHVKLNVPGGQLRFRTWGNTRMIAEPGRWIAIVSTSDGTELARAPFDVKG